MRLWTWQSPSFSLIDGHVDWSRSGFYRQGEGTIREAYERLRQKVGTDQLIWCCPGRDDWPVKSGYAEWELEVPEDRVLRFVDGGIWENRWCQLMSGPPNWLRNEFASECVNTSDFQACLKRKIREYQMREGPLFIAGLHGAPSVVVLLRHPVDQTWVMRDGRRNVQP